MILAVLLTFNIFSFLLGILRADEVIILKYTLLEPYLALSILKKTIRLNIPSRILELKYLIFQRPDYFLSLNLGNTQTLSLTLHQPELAITFLIKALIKLQRAFSRASSRMMIRGVHSLRVNRYTRKIRFIC